MKIQEGAFYVGEGVFKEGTVLHVLEINRAALTARCVKYDSKGKYVDHQSHPTYFIEAWATQRVRPK